MIFSGIFAIIVIFRSLIFSPLPTVTTLPWGTDAYVVQGVQLFRLLAGFFPPFATLLTAFLLYLGFRLSMILVKFFLGGRTPMHN